MNLLAVNNSVDQLINLINEKRAFSSVFDQYLGSAPKGTVCEAELDELYEDMFSDIAFDSILGEFLGTGLFSSAFLSKQDPRYVIKISGGYYNQGELNRDGCLYWYWRILRAEYKYPNIPKPVGIPNIHRLIVGEHFYVAVLDRLYTLDDIQERLGVSTVDLESLDTRELADYTEITPVQFADMQGDNTLYNEYGDPVATDPLGHTAHTKRCSLAREIKKYVELV